MNRSQMAAWAGMIAPLMFVGVFTIEGWLRPGYDPLDMYVSALSLGPRGWIQIANFSVFGLLMLVFTWGVAAEFQDGKASRGGVIILAIIAVCYLLSGPFVMDPTGTPREQMSVRGTVHGILGAIVFVLMPVCCFVFLRRFRVDPRWQALQGWTLGLGSLSALGMVALTVTTKPQGLQSVFDQWDGLIQRTAIIPFMVWVFLFALRLYRLERENGGLV